KSRRDATKLVNIIRPDILFLELDSDRAREIHMKVPKSEFFAARCAARQLGIDVVYGDLDYQVNMAMQESHMQELLELYPFMNVRKYERTSR
ncbi:hypothetical protein A2U01_0040654, partial [Trifolium medium]|nr:hypothetical protein [Trifolium medium]